MADAMSTRRVFLSSAAAAPLAAAAAPPKHDVSLAAWSLVRSFRKGKWTNLDLPRICREDLGVNGLEFVNQFFENPRLGYLRQLEEQGKQHGVRFVLIMIDGEGDMAAPSAAERKQAAVAHRKWVDIAAELGCHAVRCNLGGPRENWSEMRDEIVQRAAESFSDLLDYASESGLNVVIENHGRASSDPEFLPALMRAVDDPRFGTLPDFGNMNPGVDRYAMVDAIMPWAKGVSVKARWTADGQHPDWDLPRLIRSCAETGYEGFWGIESGWQAAAGRDARAMSADELWKADLQAVLLTKKVLQETLAL